MLAKLLVWAPTREQALRRMDRALEEFRVSGTGVRTTAGFLREVLRDPSFRAGEYSTSIVDQVLRERASAPSTTGDVPGAA
ncbi:MAG: hypothetical protein ACRDTF_11425 [Pseudonocardiaceae bacterium]